MLDKIALLYGSADELQMVSNTAHVIWGISLFILALLLCLYSIGHRKKFLSIAMPIELAGTVAVFLVYLFLGRGLHNLLNALQVILFFPEFSVHIAMSVISVLGLIIEFLVVFNKTKHPLAPLALPLLSSVGVGLLFIIHPRSSFHDTNTMFIHSVMGSTLIIAGMMIIIQRLITIPWYERLFGVLAAVLLSVTAFLLVHFKESPVAYQSYFFTRTNATTSLEADRNAVVYITTNGVVPQNISIKKGGHITFYQADDSWHDIASGPHPAHTNYPPLNIGILRLGESHVVTFPHAGAFGFHDHLNDGDTRLQGKIEVYK